MSFTTAPRPAATRTRGRGRGARGRGRGAAGQVTPGTETENSEQDANCRAERRDGYTMITPNEKKREKIAQQAKREEDSYRKYKESRTPKTVSYVGTVGGGPMEPSPSTPRGGARGGRSPAGATRPFGAKTSYKQSVRQQEEEDIAKKKENARRKTEENASRESERQRKLDEDRRTRNEAFLARFDKKPQAARTCGKGNSNNQEERGATASSISNQSQGNDGLFQLTQKFPYLDSDILQEMLDSVDGDVDSAIELLSGT